VISGILMELGTMRAITAFFGALAVSATLFLTGCGGGSVTVVAEVPPPPPPAFDLVMFANGVQLPGVELFPGEEQTVYLPVGQAFLLDSSGPVAWSAAVAGSPVVLPGVNGTISYGGATILQTQITNFQFRASTFLTNPIPLPAPVPTVFFATSLNDPHQVAKLNIVLTN
jgi:hypothetical protein